MSEKAALASYEDDATTSQPRHHRAPASCPSHSLAGSGCGYRAGDKGCLCAAVEKGAPCQTVSSPRATSGKAGSWKRRYLLLLGAAVAWKAFSATLSGYTEQDAACPQVPPMAPPHDERLDGFWNRLARNASDKAYERRAADSLSALIRYPTVSFRHDLAEEERRILEEAFIGLHNELETRYPLFHKHFEKDVVGNYSLLYTLKGTDTSLLPIMLCAHLDVVPVDPTTLGEWRFEPFSGKIAEGYVWGRGATDDKLPLTAIFESIELLLEGGFVSPRRGIVVALGHDEEVGGNAGARAISRYMSEVRGIPEVAFLLDEGKPMVEVKDDFSANLRRAKDQLPEPGEGGYTPVAAVGIAEKGAADLYFEIETHGGHSSDPPKHTSIGLMSILVSRIEDGQFSPTAGDQNPTLDYVECLACRLDLSNLSLWDRFVFRHVRSLKSVVAAYISSKMPELTINFRTTTAVTVFNGGVKPNVLPPTATAVINFRIAVESSVEEVVGRMQEIASCFAEEYGLNFDATGPLARKSPARGGAAGTLKLSVTGIRPPSPVSPPNSSAFRVLAGTTRHVYGENVIVTPSLMTANTDTIHYWDKTRNIFRFEPYIPGREHHTRIHDVNECAKIKSLVDAVRWYYQFVRNAMEVVHDRVLSDG